MRGRRPDQQDTVTIIPNFRDATTTHYVGLFDGHSGQRSAEYAASYLHVKLADALTETKERAIESLQLACRRTHQDIEAMKLKDGTAALLMLVVGHRFYIAHAGDSRAVLASGGKAIQLSKDHKPEDLNERERITKAGGFVAESNRVNGILALTRALGDVDLQPAVTHEPEVIEREVTEEDQFCHFGLRWTLGHDLQRASSQDRIETEVARACSREASRLRLQLGQRRQHLSRGGEFLQGRRNNSHHRTPSFGPVVYGF